MSQFLGEMMLSAGVVSAEQLKEAMGLQRSSSIHIGQALLKLGHIDETTLARYLAKQQGMPFVDLEKGRIADAVLSRISAEIALQQEVLPVMERDKRLFVAVDDPLKRIVADQLHFMLGIDVACVLAAPGALKRALRRYYGGAGEDSIAKSMKADAAEDEADAPIIRLVTRMFRDALEMRASDIHVEPGHGRLRIRCRVDGMLRDVAEHPPHLHAPLVSRLKIMATMDIAEKRKPQDGRIGLTIDGREVDVRASILPGNHGETMVLRLLDRSKSLLSLKDLGFEDEDYRWFRRIIKRPNGIVLVTGPTGSGKTTTLYAALSELNRPDVKIITAEDPVEYHIAGINQVQVHPRIGLSFGRILKAMLRCAPNIILVGEIRDVETAEIAIQSALTGHLVFSTLHTNDAPSALTRLVDIGVKPFLVSAAVQAVIAQRLVRRLCPECATEYPPSPSEVASLTLDPSALDGRKFRRARGCRACESTGYRGRIALFEHMEIDAEIRDLVFRGSSLTAIRRAAEASGNLRSLLVDGARKVLAGQTSATEVMRVTRLASEGGA
ncbi:MAG: GspE/PulE family protein [Planctomycetota bacterium]